MFKITNERERIASDNLVGRRQSKQWREVYDQLLDAELEERERNLEKSRWKMNRRGQQHKGRYVRRNEEQSYYHRWVSRWVEKNRVLRKKSGDTNKYDVCTVYCHGFDSG